jgi:hypothetical protein
MEKYLHDFDKNLQRVLLDKAEEAAAMLHREYVRRALEIEAPDILALGEQVYWPRLSSYSFGGGHILYRLDSTTQQDGIAIVYVPALKADMIGDKLNLTAESPAKSGADGERAYLEKQAEYNDEN